MRGPTVPQSHGKTFVLSDAQVAYNEGVEKALDQLIKERNVAKSDSQNAAALNRYLDRVGELRQQHGNREFVAAQV
jgi:hypothetical protein